MNTAVMSTKPPPLPCPFVVVIDTREQLNFTFDAMTADSRDGYAPLAVQTVRGTLAAGDYSIRCHEDRIAIERKSIGDLFSTLGQSRRRFEAELRRLAEYDYAAVIIEADWQSIILEPPARSQLNPKTILRSVIAWQQRYPRIHWWPCPDRDFAERVTFRILERYWKDREKERARFIAENRALASKTIGATPAVTKG